MELSKFNLNDDYDECFQRIVNINPHYDNVASHKQPMKVAFITGMMRMYYLMSYHDDRSWETLSEFAKGIEGQALEYFEDVDENIEIKKLMMDVGIEARPEQTPELKKAIDDLKELNASKERKKMFKFPMQMAMVLRTLIVMYIPIYHWMHPELKGWQLFGEIWPALIPLAFIFYYEYKMEKIIKPKLS